MALTDIEGIGPALAEKLKSAGVGSIARLLEKGATKKGRQELAAASEIGESLLLKFVNHADLMRIKGIGGEYAELLEASGVDTVPALARRNPENLHARMAEVNAEKKLVRSLPSVGQVTRWVEQARTLDRVVEY
ncbi:ferredoxin [Rhodothermaceae bacterium RA]|nr:ferredoxin [Rhodothermaceae bacterium RA]